MNQTQNTTLPARTIWYDPTVRRREFFGLLHTLNTWLQGEAVRQALGATLHQELNDRLQAVRERLVRDFRLVVLGDFKRGKSTLINALLGSPVVSSDVRTETVTINEIRYGAQFQIHACLENGGQVPLRHEELKSERLTPILKQLPHPVSHLRLQVPIEWLRRICLVDTPGTGDLEWRFDKQVQAYLPNADAVIYVISALSPLSQTELAFLQMAVSPQDFPKIIFVVNMMDVPRSQQDAQRVLASIQGKINVLFPHAQVFGLSALDELCRLQNVPRPNPQHAEALAHAFESFRQHLQESILLNRDLIHLDRAFVQVGFVLDTFVTHTRRLQQALQASQQQLVDAIAQCENENSELRQNMAYHRAQVRAYILSLGQQTVEWLNEFVERLATDVTPQLSRLSLEDIRRHFPFFLMDMLSEAVNTCLESHRTALIGSLNNINRAVQADIHRLVSLTGGTNVAPVVSKFSFSNAAWGNMETLHFLVDQALGGLFNVAADLLMNQAKKMNQAQKRTTYQQQFRASLPHLRQSLTVEIQSLYQQIANEIDQQITAAYQEQIDISLAALRQAQTFHQTGSAHAANTSHLLQDIQNYLGQTGVAFNQLQQQLWPERLAAN